MTTKNQQEEMVNTFVASIPTMQTDIALLKQDTNFLREASKTQDAKSDAILKSVGDLSVVSKVEFEKYQQDEQTWKEELAKSNSKRFQDIEDFINENKPGIKFANALVSRWTTFLVLLLLTAAVIALVGKFIPIGG